MLAVIRGLTGFRHDEKVGDVKANCEDYNAY